MNKNNKNVQNKKISEKLDNISLENKLIKQSLDLQFNSNVIDNSNAYYSERYGWTLRKN